MTITDIISILSITVALVFVIIGIAWLIKLAEYIKHRKTARIRNQSIANELDNASDFHNLYHLYLRGRKGPLASKIEQKMMDALPTEFQLAERIMGFHSIIWFLHYLPPSDFRDEWLEKTRERVLEICHQQLDTLQSSEQALNLARDWRTFFFHLPQETDPQDENKPFEHHLFYDHLLYGFSEIKKSLDESWRSKMDNFTHLEMKTKLHDANTEESVWNIIRREKYNSPLWLQCMEKFLFLREQLS